MRDTPSPRLREQARESMLAQVEEADRGRRAFRSNWWLEIASVASATFAVLISVAAVGWWVRFGLRSTQAPTLWSPQLYVSGHHLVAGLLPPGVAVTAAAAAVELNREMMKALKPDAPIGSARQRAVTAQRRSLLRLVASLTTVAAALTGVVVWANISSAQDAGTALLACALAAVAVFFGIMARNYSDSQEPDRFVTFGGVKATIDHLNVWDGLLSTRNVPRPLTLSEADAQCAGPRQRCVRACGMRVAAVGTAAAAYFVLALVVAVCVHGGVHRHPPLLPAVASILRVALIEAGLAALSVAAVGYESVCRWRRFTASKRPRRQLVIKPLVLYAFCGLFVALTWLAEAIGNGLFVTVAVGGEWAFFPVLVGGVLWASRRWPDTRWLQTATWPVWGLVQVSLHRARITAQSEYDRLEAEEAAAAAAALTSPPTLLERFHRVWSTMRPRTNTDTTPTRGPCRGAR